MNFEEINGAQFNEGLKVVIYGQEGVGKSTLAASFPGAVFIDCEGSTSRMNVRRLPRPTSWEMLEQETDFILANCMTKGYQTVIIDTFDWAERLALDAICADNNVTGIEGIGYGKGWEYEKEKIGHFLDKTDRLIKAGVNIVLLCHAISRKSTLPEAMEEFDHWELKLGNKTTNKIAPLLKEWSDMTLFLAFRTNIVAVDDKGKKHKATSCERVMYTTKSAWWDAKNRFGLPPVMPLAWESISPIFSNAVQPQMQMQTPTPTVTPVTSPPPVQSPPPAPAPVTTPPAQQVIEKAQELGIATAESLSEYTDITPYERVKGVPDALADLMEANNVTAQEVEYVCSELKHYMPAGTPLQNYPPDFINGCLIAAWGQVFAEIEKSRVPFV